MHSLVLEVHVWFRGGCIQLHSYPDQITFGPNSGCLVSKKQNLADKNYVVYEVTSYGFCFIQNRLALLVDAVSLIYSPLLIFFLLVAFTLHAFLLDAYLLCELLCSSPFFLFVVLNNYYFLFFGAHPFVV